MTPMEQRQRRSDMGMALLRILTGILFMFHGLELFDNAVMEKYLSWDSIRALPLSTVMVYLGKAMELAAGILLTMGLFTRVGAVLGIMVMLFICFYVGNGRFWYEDQHPFLFAM
ncbi:MAG TPA: DoxX family protein, partial [Phnomibacter sp.]|nr:DoxX family protein [Phnomibacter sp.]